MVGDSSLPGEPAAVIVSDLQGRTRWTVSIPNEYGFPLRPSQYKEICKQSEEMSLHMADLGVGTKLRKRHMGYYGVDPNFLDIAEAERLGILSSSSKDSSRKGQTGSSPKTCEKSLTYVLETTDAGMGISLMGLWMAYGLAQKEERAFFVDDTRW